MKTLKLDIASIKKVPPNAISKSNKRLRVESKKFGRENIKKIHNSAEGAGNIYID